MRIAAKRRAINLNPNKKLFEEYLARFENLSVSVVEHYEAMLLAEIKRSDEEVADNLGMLRRWALLNMDPRDASEPVMTK